LDLLLCLFSSFSYLKTGIKLRDKFIAATAVWSRIQQKLFHYLQLAWYAILRGNIILGLVVAVLTYVLLLIFKLTLPCRVRSLRV